MHWKNIKIITTITGTLLLLYLYSTESLYLFPNFDIFLLSLIFIFLDNFIYSLRLQISYFKSLSKMTLKDLLKYLYFVNLLSYMIPFRLGDIILIKFGPFKNIDIFDNYISILKLKFLDTILMAPLILFLFYDLFYKFIFLLAFAVMCVFVLIRFFQNWI